MTPQQLQDILDRCASGDTTAFRCVMAEYQGYAYAVAIRLVCNETEARDIVQESFIRIWNNAGRYKPENKFTTWLYSIVTNLCLDRLRAQKRKPVSSMEDIDASLLPWAAAEDDPEHVFTTHEVSAAIDALAEQLPPKQKIVFVLRDKQELSVREVCDILGISEGAVKTNLVYARKFIRERLERY